MRNTIHLREKETNRKNVFLLLDKPLSPSELVLKIHGKNSNTYFNIVSRGLSELKEKGLVEIVNPEDRTGRIYQRTNFGEKIFKQVIK